MTHATHLVGAFLHSRPFLNARNASLGDALALRVPAAMLALAVIATAPPRAAAQSGDRHVRVVTSEEERIPTKVTPPSRSAARKQQPADAGPSPSPRYVRVVQARGEDASAGRPHSGDADLTLSPEDIDYLKWQLRNRGFSIDERTGRPLWTGLPFSVFYPYLAYPDAGLGGRWHGHGRGHGGYLNERFYDRDLRRFFLDSAAAARGEERDDARRRFNQEDMTRRAHKVLSAHDRALEEGVEQLRAGRYAEAVIALTLAAELDNGDPACRIHLAQARLARGHYAEAAEALRRALELQPKLVYIPLHLARYYPGDGDFARHVDELELTLSDRADADEFFLLGYMRFQLGDLDRAHQAFVSADRRRTDDKLTRQFLDITAAADPSRG